MKKLFIILLLIVGCVFADSVIYKDDILMFKRTKTLNKVDYIGIEEFEGKPVVKILIQSGGPGNQYTFISCDKIIELKNYNGEPIDYDCININNPINSPPPKDSTQLDINNIQKTPVIGGALLLSNTEKDCAGVAGGVAVLDDCGVCDGIDGYVAGSCYDCAGAANGTAVEDCLGFCGGDAVLSGCDNACKSTAVEDCAGVCGGNSYLDECGGCDANVNNDCIQDCAGEWGGTSVYDECSICGGTGIADGACDCYGNADKDCAGVCGGDAVTLWDDCYTVEGTTTLNLYDNQLSGDIPPEIGNLTNLSYLNIGYNEFTGSIPSEIGNLTNLTTLWLGSNELTGEIPSTIGNLTNLTWLWLTSNQLTGEIPSTIGNLTNLTVLYLNSNQLTGEIPQAVCDLIESRNLGMSYILDGNNLINTCD